MYPIKGWLPRVTEYLPLVIVLVFMSVCDSGCIWLALPSLAYEGYKYEHQSNSGSSPAADVQSSKSQAISHDGTSNDDSFE